MSEEVKSHPYNFTKLPVGRINVNHNYQRDEVPQVVKNILSSFDYHKVNPIKCAYRDGNYYAFDGQNTAIGLTMLFGGKYMAPALIYNDLETADDEAKLFEEINDKKYRKAITIADEWKSRLFRGDSAPTEILKILRTNGLELANGSNNGKYGVIPASLFKTMESLYQSYGEGVFSETMSVFSGAWKSDKEAYRKPVICGLAKFVDTYRGEYIKRGLIDRLNRVGAEKVFTYGQMSLERGYKKYAKEILAAYNHGTSTNRLTDKL